MRALSISFGAIAAVSLVACSVSSTDNGGGSSGQPASSSSANPPSSSGGTSAPSTGSTPAVSTIAANVSLDAATCPAFSPCGGNPVGTYDYAGGCVADAFAQARAQCPSLDTSNVHATVQGSITLDGVTLNREATAHLTGSIFIPSACSYGQCASVESSLKGGFDSLSCAAKNGGCECQLAKTDHDKDVSSYTISGSTLTTSGGDKYTFCAQGSSLDYTGKSASAEDGTWTMKKR